MAQAIIQRPADGLCFEPCLQPGMLRCEACLALVAPEKVRQHICTEWWTEPLDRQATIFKRVHTPRSTEKEE